MTTVPGSNNPLLTYGIPILLIIVLCYAAGRMHQWYKAADDREAAYRDGYDTATKSLFSTATRTASGLIRPRGAVAAVAPVPPSPRPRPEVEQPSVQRAAQAARHRADSRRLENPETMIIGHAGWDDRLSA